MAIKQLVLDYSILNFEEWIPEEAFKELANYIFGERYLHVSSIGYLSQSIKLESVKYNDEYNSIKYQKSKNIDNTEGNSRYSEIIMAA